MSKSTRIGEFRGLSRLQSSIYHISIQQHRLDQLQVTQLVITHRLSTIRNADQIADQIYVLQADQIVQQGSFTELENQAELFVQLMAQQVA